MADIKRLNYFNGQFLVDKDFNDEQAYHLALQRYHQQQMHTPGVTEGLDIPAPLSATSIKVNSGKAFDRLGRRIVLDLDQTIDLSDGTAYPVGSTIYVTIRYAESQTDESSQTGTKGPTRWTEAPVVEAKITAPDPNDPQVPLLLGVVTKASGGLTVDSAGRLNAGTKGGDLSVNSVTLENNGVAQAQWPKLYLASNGLTAFDNANFNGLNVSGDIKVTGKVDNRDVSNDGAALDAHVASTSNPHQTTAAQIDNQGGTNQIVNQINANPAATRIADTRIAHTAVATGAHPATAISAAAHNNISGPNVQAQLQEIVTDLASQTGPGTGASLVGNDAFGASPNNVVAGTVRTQLSSLLTLLTNHLANATGAHAASAISVLDSANQLSGANVEAALAEIVSAFANDHNRGQDTGPGLHKTIHQAVVPNTNNVGMLFDLPGVGSASSHVRVYNDPSYLWITVNAFWNTSFWSVDSTLYPATAIRLSRLDFALLWSATGNNNFTSWGRTWTLPLNNGGTAFELTGSFTETGRAGAFSCNPDPTSARTVYSGGSVTLRSRFPVSPSSVTLSPLIQYQVANGPILWQYDRDGFAFYFYNTGVGPSSNMYWFGTYTAVV